MAGRRTRIVVVGGGVVEVEAIGGKVRARAAVANYLHELGQHYSEVVFFAQSMSRPQPMFSSDLRTGVVRWRSLGFALRQGWFRRCCAYLDDLRNMYREAKRSDGVIEFAPAAGGFLGSLVLRLGSPRYVAYFGMNPRRRWALSRRLGLWGNVRNAWLLIGGLITERIGMAVLVRDEAQAARLRGRGNVHVSAPITATRPLQPADPDHDGQKQARPVILFVGALHERKGIRELLQAMKRLKEMPDIVGGPLLRIVGGASLSATESYEPGDIVAMAMELGLSECVDVVGFVDDMDRLSEIYQAAACLVLPSKAEGFPRVLNEAIAHGVPIVASRLPEIAATLTDGRHALLVTPGDIGDLTRGLKDVLCDRGASRQMADQASVDFAGVLSCKASEQHRRILDGIGKA